jgi:hypothetical protein
MGNGTAPLSPGWVVRLTGHEADFSCWERCLRPPFDPWCERIPRDGSCVWALRSRYFDHLQIADEVRDRAIPLIQQLNGALGVGVNAEPLTFDGVGHIDDQGGFNSFLFAELHDELQARDTFSASVEVRDANGNLIPPPPPEESATQRWMRAAEEDDDIADMLAFAGRADNWFDIYKTIELAQKLAGGQHKLIGLLGGSYRECERMRRTANFYRHARDSRPPKILTTLAEARPLLSLIVRTVLDG